MLQKGVSVWWEEEGPNKADSAEMKLGLPDSELVSGVTAALLRQFFTTTSSTRLLLPHRNVRL